jgi:hypothetical protein
LFDKLTSRYAVGVAPQQDEDSSDANLAKGINTASSMLTAPTLIARARSANGKRPLDNHGREKRPSLAVGAVQSEPFSTANSLLTGKITGNRAVLASVQAGAGPQIRHLTGFGFRTLSSGTGNLYRWNREFWKQNRD